MSARYMIIASKFNDLVTKHLVQGAREAFAEAGLQDGDIDMVWVPGAFELPIAAARAAKTRAYSAVICLGAVIRGETPHFDYVCDQAAAGMMKASLDSGVPVIFGVLTTDTAEQALNRCGIKGGNKGKDCAAAALATVKTLQQIDKLANR
jgi:6,7-dimethyl-8-ribityllumazine synthase